MSCYFIARITIKDRAEYRRYLKGFDAILNRYDARVLLVDDAPVVLEGRERHKRVVLIRFRTMREAKRWYHSAEYQAIARHRHRASRADILLAHGRV